MLTPETPLTLHYGQRRLLEDRTKFEHAVIAGAGYGKSSLGPKWSLKRSIDNMRSPVSLVLAPDYRLLKTRCLAEFESYLVTVGLVHEKDFRIYESAGDMRIVYRWGPTPWGQSVYFISGGAPEKIISYNASHAWVDEPAIMDAAVIERLLQRLRCPFAEYIQMLLTGTPEGVNWFALRYEECERVDGTPHSESKTKLVLHGATFDNPYLSKEFLEMIEREFSWDPSLWSNYVLGIPTSLAKNRYYFAFDPKGHVVNHPPDEANRTLYVSFDNNVGQLTSICLQEEAGVWYAVGDNGGKAQNVEHACQLFVEQYPPHIWGGHTLVVLGDAALHNRSPVSYSTGYDLIHTLLRPYYPHILIQAPRSNSFIEERQRTTNKAFNEGRLMIHQGAKKLIESLRAVEIQNGKPKKGSGDTITHAGEALDHAIFKLMPPLIRREYQGIK